ncbi:MAG: hypothetical protein MK009_03560 [Gammaproteobacteria bacterium]|nr:hypothetical protein [Gammaproteobacteria bacterium]
MRAKAITADPAADESELAAIFDNASAWLVAPVLVLLLPFQQLGNTPFPLFDILL